MNRRRFFHAASALAVVGHAQAAWAAAARRTAAGNDPVGRYAPRPATATDDGAAALVDDDEEGARQAAPGASGATVELTVRAPARCNVLRLQEPIARGQVVERFEVSADSGAGWEIVASGTTIGYRRLVRFPARTIAGLRVHVESSLDAPRLSRVALYRDALPPVPPAAR